MKPSHWRVDKPSWDNWVFYIIPSFFVFGLDTKRPEYRNWGVGVCWLFWIIEFWSKPIPREHNEPTGSTR